MVADTFKHIAARLADFITVIDYQSLFLKYCTWITHFLTRVQVFFTHYIQSEP